MQDTYMKEAEKDCLKWAASSLFSGKGFFSFRCSFLTPGLGGSDTVRVVSK